MATLHTDFTTQVIDENKISALNKKVISYLDQVKQGACIDDLLAEESDWQVFFLLSELRTGLVSWYDFGENSSVLEVGAGFGTVTEMLCRKCHHVTATEQSLYRAKVMADRLCKYDNLDVYVGDIKDIQFDKQFDYIIVASLLERMGRGTADRQSYVDYIHSVTKFLKLDGKLLIAVDNRFGLRYICGEVDPNTGVAFGSLNQSTPILSEKNVKRSFSKNELQEIIDAAGFTKSKFYYPLPDYKLPQLIYTDSHLPEKNLRERLIPYYRRSDTLVASEKDLYDEVIAGGAFPFMANSFVVEATVDGELGDVTYAAISTDRGHGRSFATVITSDESGMESNVNKMPLYDEGKQSAAGLIDSVRDLEAHSIPVVEHSLNADGTITMPYIKSDTLSNYIKKVMPTNVDKFLSIVDRIWDYILRSSEEVGADDNRLIDHLVEIGKGTREELLSKDFGPILKRAYMELIPLNCFYDEVTEEFIYFDQEFVRGNYPAKYVLFRAIHYIYCFTKGAENYYPKAKLLEKYGMTDTWDYYLAEEQEFINVVRNHDRYKQFYKWTEIDGKRIYENAKRLESMEERMANYLVSDQMKQIWNVELEMLDEIDRICRENDLTYFLVHGSLLGAVRHKGFIPWDDDLDIALPRTDYDKLRQLLITELKSPLEALDYHNARSDFRGGIMRIRNAATTGIQKSEFGHEGNHGIWIDILPLDVCPEDESKSMEKSKRVRHIHRLFQAKIYGKEFVKKYADMSVLTWQWYKFVSFFFSFNSLAKKLDAAMTMHSDIESQDVAFYTGSFKHKRLSASDFSETVYLDFAGRKVPAPKGYESYMFKTLGKDYMKYPPEEQRKPNHTGIFDPKRPYTDYEKELTGMFDGAKGKKIVLFGSGLMFEDYMQKYGNRFRPAYLLDNDENKWGRRRMGIEICPPGKLDELNKDKIHLIICSYYYREISKQLEEMGYRDYKIYVQKLEWIIKTENEK